MDKKENPVAAIFPSAGGCGEHITIYSAEQHIPRSQLSEWEGRLTGERASGEKTTLKVVSIKRERSGCQIPRRFIAVAGSTTREKIIMLILHYMING
jgi:hypothetical protein